MDTIIIQQIVNELLNPSQDFMKLGQDKYRNDKNVLLMKSILGALRPWWAEAYDTCLNGDDFNVPEIHPDWIANPLRGFKDHHHELLTAFATAIANNLGYVNADDQEEREWEQQENEREEDEYDEWLDMTRMKQAMIGGN